MGAGKEVGKALFGLAGLAMKSGGKFLGEKLNSDFISEVGESAGAVTERTGELLGQAVDGVGSAVSGVVTGDSSKISSGADEFGGAVGSALTGAATGVGQVFTEGKRFAKGVIDGDTAAVKSSGRTLAKNACVAVIGVGVLDFCGAIDVLPDAPVGGDGPEGVDGLADNSAADESNVAGDGVEDIDPASEVGVLSVEPHYVFGHFRDDGVYVDGYWRDGDGDTSVDLSAENGGGYLRSDPDGDPSNNLS